MAALISRILGGAAAYVTVLVASACSFSPAALPAVSGGVYGDACASGSECASGVCGEAATCVECRGATTCGSGRTCDPSGRCVAVTAPTGPRAHERAAGAESANAVRKHVGRVAVVPVSSSEVR